MTAQIIERIPGFQMPDDYCVRIYGHDFFFHTPDQAEDFAELCGCEYEYVPFMALVTRYAPR